MWQVFTKNEFQGKKCTTDWKRKIFICFIKTKITPDFFDSCYIQLIMLTVNNYCFIMLVINSQVMLSFYIRNITWYKQPITVQLMFTFCYMNVQICFTVSVSLHWSFDDENYEFLIAKQLGKHTLANYITLNWKKQLVNELCCVGKRVDFNTK